jgi:nucleotide-binding universal stress UspA family protein
MTAPKHLLVAVDFTSASDHALERALDMAAGLGARVTVIHVYAVRALRIADSDYIPSADEVSRVSAEAEQKLEAVMARHQRQGVAIDFHLRTGRPPAEEINTYAAEIGADLIVVGTHNRGALGRVILGSVAEDVIRAAKIPVLTVHEPTK